MGCAITRTAALLLLAACCPALGCGETESKQEGAGVRSERAAPPEEPAAPAPPPPPPAPGSARIEFADGLVTVVSNAAPRDALLAQLGEAAGFRLATGELDARPVTLRIERARLEDAVSALVGDLPYRIGYEFDLQRDRHVVSRLRVGVPRPSRIADRPPRGRRSTRRSAADEAAAWRPGRVAISEEKRREIDERVAEAEWAEADLAEQLRSSGARVRAEAAAEIDPSGEGLQTLLDALYDDPEASVRTAAARRLGDADGFAAVAGLVDALGDPDPEVVVAAIEALEFHHDETIVPYLRELAGGHPDAGVRSAAASAIESLE